MRYRILFHFGLIKYLLALCITGLGSLSYADTPSRDERVRAAMIYNFARFTRWPTEDNQSHKLTLCVNQNHNLSVALEDINGKSVGGKPLKVISSMSRLENCQIAVVSEADWQGVVQASQTGLLVVGEVKGLANYGGAIELVRVGRQVRFVVNPDAARRVDLELSSKLIELAVVVK